MTGNEEKDDDGSSVHMIKYHMRIAMAALES